MGAAYVRRGSRNHVTGGDMLAIELAPESLETTIGKQIEPQPNGCWLWREHTDQYGCTTIRGMHIIVHRFVYETLVGEIPEGFDIHHECETPGCCNPAHLTPLSRSDHLLGHHARIRARRAHAQRDQSPDPRA